MFPRANLMSTAASRALRRMLQILLWKTKGARVGWVCTLTQRPTRPLAKDKIRLRYCMTSVRRLKHCILIRSNMTPLCAHVSFLSSLVDRSFHLLLCIVPKGVLSSSDLTVEGSSHYISLPLREKRRDTHMALHITPVSRMISRRQFTRVPPPLGGLVDHQVDACSVCSIFPPICPI